MRRIAVLIAATALTLFLMKAGIIHAEDDLFDTKTAATLFDRGMQSLKDKKVDEAIKAFEESVTVAPEARAFYFLGYAYYLKGRGGDNASRKKSIENFEKAFELDPAFKPDETGSIDQPAPKQDDKAETQPAPGDSAHPKLETSRTGNAVARQQ